jgi:hypothetical protein
MNKQKPYADLLREIVEQSIGHGIELLSLVELMDSGGVNERLAQAGLENAANPAHFKTPAPNPD